MRGNKCRALAILLATALLCSACAQTAVTETASVRQSAESEAVSESADAAAKEPQTGESGQSADVSDVSDTQPAESDNTKSQTSEPVSEEPQPETSGSSVTEEPEPEVSGQAEESAPAGDTEAEASAQETVVPADEAEMELVPLSGSAPVSSVLTPTAPGTVTYGNQKVDIDASNTADGYVMIRYLGQNGKVKIQITGPSGVTYTYNVTTPGSYEVFPLSDGSGTYKIGVYENTSGKKYAAAYSLSSLSVNLRDAFAPFLRANQYVNYNRNSKCVSLAAQLCQGCSDTLSKINAVYTYVINNISYDYNLAANVKSGYLPDLDNVLKTGKGICFDYAALMTAMLRSQGIPTKLVVGYSGQAYHAWINTYSDEEGWMDAVIYFDGTRWKLMDPTYASTGNSDASIMEYIGNGANYTAKYLY